MARSAAAPWVVPAAVAVWSLARRRAWRDPAEIPWIALALWAVGVLGLTALSPSPAPLRAARVSGHRAAGRARLARTGGAALAAAHAVLFAGARRWPARLAWTGDGGVLTR